MTNLSVKKMLIYLEHKVYLLVCRLLFEAYRENQFEAHCEKNIQEQKNNLGTRCRWEICNKPKPQW